MTQQQFGLWAAIAIHDTSSVVGAAMSYGNEALQVATTVKVGASALDNTYVFNNLSAFQNKGREGEGSMVYSCFYWNCLLEQRGFNSCCYR